MRTIVNRGLAFATLAGTLLAAGCGSNQGTGLLYLSIAADPQLPDEAASKLLISYPGGANHVYPGKFPPNDRSTLPLKLQIPNLPASDTPVTFTVQGFDTLGCAVTKPATTGAVIIKAGAETARIAITLVKSDTNCADGGTPVGASDGGGSTLDAAGSGVDGATNGVDGAGSTGTEAGIAVLDGATFDTSAVDSTKDGAQSTSAEAGSVLDGADAIHPEHAEVADTPLGFETGADVSLGTGGVTSTGGISASGGVAGSSPGTGGIAIGGVTGTGGMNVPGSGGASGTGTGGSGTGGVTGSGGSTVKPANLVPSPTSLGFSSSSVGQSSAEASFTISNSGDLASTTIAIGIAGASPGDFVISPPTGNDCVSTTTTLAGGATCTVRTVFRPTVTGLRNATITFSAATGGSGNVPVAGGGWTGSGSMATNRPYHTATLLVSGKVLVAGGGYGIPIFQSADLYDPGNGPSGTWLATMPMTTARGQHTATLLGNGKVLVVGGSDTGFHGIQSAELYDPDTASWSTVNPMNTGRYDHTATLLRNGKVLVTGGVDVNNQSLQSVELYDPGVGANGTWSTINPMKTARSGHTATLLNNDKVLVVGGSSAELFDPTDGSWTLTGAMGTAVYSRHTATLLNDGKMLVAGGFGYGSNGLCPTDGGGACVAAHVYDPGSGTVGTWSLINPMSIPRAYFTATLLNNGKVLVTGGRNGAGDASAELYDPVTGIWSMTGAMGTVRAYDTATLLVSGKVLVAGSDATSELYDPGP